MYIIFEMKLNSFLTGTIRDIILNFAMKTGLIKLYYANEFYTI